eukprot:3068153-Amphidinium_carterae.2
MLVSLATEVALGALTVCVSPCHRSNLSVMGSRLLYLVFAATLMGEPSLVSLAIAASSSFSFLTWPFC